MAEPVLTIDPRRQFGRVCINGTRIPAESVAECVFAGDSVDEVADAYEITRDEVLVACWWFTEEQRTYRTKSAKAVAARWGAWAVEALRVLGGHVSGPLFDPPDIDMEATK